MIPLLNTSADKAVMNNNHFKTRQRKTANAGLMKLFSNALLVTLLLIPKVGFSTVPEQINYQGLLKDSSDLPITGSVNFDFAVYDALTSGAQLWTETQNGVSVLNGLYSVALGSVTPLTASILSSGTVYLETTVNGETLQPRERLLAVPYALRAQEADNVGGVSNSFIQQIFQYGNHDGGGPANDDPREGFIDTDGDGKANFIDSDNDNDGYSDSIEISNGSDMNVVTPKINSFIGPIPGAPDEAILGESNLFAIAGTTLLSGLTVQVGPESPAAQNLTSTSFDITVGVGQVSGTQNISVTLSNGETVTTGPITFRPFMPKIFSFTGPFPAAPDEAVAAEANLFSITGTEFLPGMTVQVGSENPVPQSLTSTSFDITIGLGQSVGPQNLIVTLPNGETDTAGPITFFVYIPKILSFTGPNPAAASEALAGKENLFTVTGTDFFPGLTVQVGPENPVPQNLTSTSFDITVGLGQQVLGPQDLIVTLPNGETDTASSINFVAAGSFAFVSSTTQANALSQTVATNDAFCATAAANAGLSGSFVAWYSDATSNAKDRLTPLSIVRRIDGVQVATSLTDLIDGSIGTSMSIDENGAQVSGAIVATHTSASGVLAPDSCTGSNPTIGVVGRTSAFNSNWTQAETASCSSALRLYCFEQ